MKKAALILFATSIFIIILYLIINGFDSNSLKQEQYNPPICGNNICEEDEGSYCLDCNLSCKSEELCNSKINVICDNCTETQKKLLLTLFEHQTIAYDCLANYYNYNPPRLIYHAITHTNIIRESCTKEEGCYISGGGVTSREGVRQSFIPGLREYNENDVTKKENVGFEVHELAHVFTYYGLGIVQSWLTEGISIYTESRILCHSDSILSNKMDDFSSLYIKLKNNETTLDEIAPYDEYYKTKHNSHRIGSMYFGALEQDYNCNKECIAKILYSLYVYKENCVGDCFENAKESIPQIMNLSLNNNDLRVPIITNKIIKQKSEEIIKKDLTSLFELLEIEY